METQRPNLTRNKCRMCVLFSIELNITNARSTKTRAYWVRIQQEQLKGLSAYANRKLPNLCQNEVCVRRWIVLRKQLYVIRREVLLKLRHRVTQAEYKLQEYTFKLTTAQVSNTVSNNTISRLEFYVNIARLSLAQRQRRLEEARNMSRK